MASWLIRPLLNLLGTPLKHGRKIDTNFSIFQEGDRVVLQARNPVLSKPLKRDRKIVTSRGILEHNDIIGRSSRDKIQAHKGHEYRVTYPTLEEYVTLTPRLVTPVYPADANLIVSLLDIHAPPPPSLHGSENEALEILEAGTGHGSLTLHLSRAINGANSCPPPIPTASQLQILQKNESQDDVEKTTASQVAEVDSLQREWDEWRSHRRAVLHTVDVSSKYSSRAESNVRGFRRGIYAGNVDFYVSSVEKWIQEQTRRRSKRLLSGTVNPFLNYVLLDMPSAHLRIPLVAPIIKTDGVLAVFMPNITQIGDCVKVIREQRLPFTLDKAVELGTGISSGRLWDLRMVTPRPNKNLANDSAEKEPEQVTEDMPENSSDNGSDEDVTTSSTSQIKDEPVLVCRPKVGDRICGGGFVGIWRKMNI